MVSVSVTFSLHERDTDRLYAALEAVTETLALEADPEWNIKVRLLQYSQTDFVTSSFADHTGRARVLPHESSQQRHNPGSASCILKVFLARRCGAQSFRHSQSQISRGCPESHGESVRTGIYQ